MTAKEYLSQARQMERRIGALLERRGRYMELQARRGPGRSQALRTLEEEIDARIDAYAEQVRLIEGLIDGVEDGTCREVLRYRYLNGWSLRAIAGRMNYSEDWLGKLHARGLEAVERDLERRTGQAEM